MSRHSDPPRRSRYVSGVVESVDENEGWGVLSAERVPGGCFVNSSLLRRNGRRDLVAGQRVEFLFDELGYADHGCRFRAVAVWPAKPSRERIDGRDLRRAEDHEISMAHDLFAHVITEDRQGYLRLLDKWSLADDAALREMMLGIGMLATSAAFARRRFWHLLPRQAERSRIVASLTNGPFGDLIGPVIAERYLSDMSARRPHTPIDTSLTGMTTFLVMGGTLLSRHLGSGHWEETFDRVMKQMWGKYGLRPDMVRVEDS